MIEIDDDHVDTLADILKSWWTKACRWVMNNPTAMDAAVLIADRPSTSQPENRRPLRWTDEYFLGCPVIVLSGDKCEDVAIGFAVDYAELGANQYTLVVENYLGATGDNGIYQREKIISFGRMFPYSESLLCALAALSLDEVTAITARGATMLVDPDQPEKLLTPPNRAESVLNYEKVKAVLKHEGFYDHEFFMEKVK